MEKLLRGEPTVITSNTVFTTTDYFLFKPIDGNRNKNLTHINKLKQSIKQNYLYTVIIVNERYEIIDGQHRFDVIKELNLPLNYIVCKGYGLNEVHILNHNSRTWNSDDYLDGYCKLGYKDYLIYREFKNKYNLGHNEVILLLGNSNETFDSFKSGQFKVNSVPEAEVIVKKILGIEPYYEGVRRRNFMLAIIGLLKNSNFEYDEFIKKLKIQPTILQDCTSVSTYKAHIEDIYNYRRKEKVNLRF